MNLLVRTREQKFHLSLVTYFYHNNQNVNKFMHEKIIKVMQKFVKVTESEGKYKIKVDEVRFLPNIRSTHPN